MEKIFDREVDKLKKERKDYSEDSGAYIETTGMIRGLLLAKTIYIYNNPKIFIKEVLQFLFCGALGFIIGVLY